MDKTSFFSCITLITIFFQATLSDNTNKELLVLTVATQANDGYHRFVRTADQYDINVKVLGMGQEWLGGDMNYVGGGQKVNFLKEELEQHKDEEDLIVMFVDSYDVLLTSTAREILAVFNKFDCKVVFSAERFCWPDSKLASAYPEVKSNEKRFLNSGGFIGYSRNLFEIVSHKPIANGDDDQLYYTQIYLDRELREKHAMKLDTKSEIFQNLHGALDEVKVKFKGENSYLYNMKTGAIPIVVHGNGPVKVELNSMSNYLADSWTPNTGCQSCLRHTIDLSTYKEDELPLVYVSVHVEHATPFLDDFFTRLALLDYPKTRMHLLIHYMVEYHEKHVTEFMRVHGESYISAKVLTPANSIEAHRARNMAMSTCVALNCDYYLSVDGEAYLENNRTLRLLIQRNRSIVAPLLVRPGKMWSTFWGALSADGYYKRSDDYADIVQYKKIGMWNVPFMTNMYLVQGGALRELEGAYHSTVVDYDMAFCQRAREKNLFMYVDNMEYYGFLINSEEYDLSHHNNDLWQIWANRYAWDKKFVQREYYTQLEADFKVEEPCTDVYWFPVFTPAFCQLLIDEVEHFGLWSGGKHNDPRLAGGYENVPTDDVHMTQIGFEQGWLYILKEYVAPYTTKFYRGYYTESRAIMNFMVRYKPTVQDRLRPHHDASTYTINMALNRVNDDYEGGGVRFTRYNCSVVALREGWMLMHPGRLTHEHEGLPTTAGTRYIMVSFIDP